MIATQHTAPRPRFPLGRVVATPGALTALAAAGLSPDALLTRHVAGDWGDVGTEDATERRLCDELATEIPDVLAQPFSCARAAASGPRCSWPSCTTSCGRRPRSRRGCSPA